MNKVIFLIQLTSFVLLYRLQKFSDMKLKQENLFLAKISKCILFVLFAKISKSELFTFMAQI